MGRTPTEEGPKYQIESIWAVHREIIRRLVLGQKNVEIAKDLDITPETVSYVKNSQLVKDKIAEMQSELDGRVLNVKERIDNIAPKALDVLEKIIAGDTEFFDNQNISVNARYKAANNVLKKAGHVAPSGFKGDVNQTIITGDYLSKLKSRVKEADNVVVDVEEN